MAFDLYKYAMAAVTAVLILLWSMMDEWGAFEFIAIFLMAFPLYIPLLYRLGKILWVARKRRQLGLPTATDRDIIDFVGEELDRAVVPWQWTVALRRTSRWDQLEIGEDDEPPVYVRVDRGILEVSSDEAGSTRFVDPAAAVDYALSIYGGAVKMDEAVFGEAEDVPA